MAVDDDFGKAETHGLMVRMDLSPLPTPKMKEDWIRAHEVIMETNQSYIRSTFEERGELMPRFIGVGAKEGRLFMCSMEPVGLSKNDTAFAVRRLARREKFFTLYHFDEAWIVTEPKDTAAARSAAQAAYEQRLHRHPDREECVMLSADSKVEGVRTGMWMAIIKRSADGKGQLGPWEDRYTGPDSHLMGRFMHLLHEPPTPAEA